MSLPPKPVAPPPVVVDTKAINLFNEMSYEILSKHPKAKEYLRLLEEFLMKPVLPFGKEISWGYGNEGRNDFIRNMINGSHKFMNERLKTPQPKSTKRTRTRKV